jgi:hypothetical protein
MPFDGSDSTITLVRNLNSGKVPGVVIYRGKSMLDYKPIVAIATSFTGSNNSKTGSNIIQVYILRDEIDPVTAARQGDDYSICGNCPHRGEYKNGQRVEGTRSCYVTLMHGPSAVYRAHQRGSYANVPEYQISDIFAGKFIRMGAYGDPAAVPVAVWQNVMRFASGATGYTHQWHRKRAQALREWCMASADTPNQRSKANALGWRVFRVAPVMGWSKLTGEVLCPASAEAGKKTTCAACKACGGLSSKAKADIMIPAHAAGAKTATRRGIVRQ